MLNEPQWGWRSISNKKRNLRKVKIVIFYVATLESGSFAIYLIISQQFMHFLMVPIQASLVFPFLVRGVGTHSWWCNSAIVINYQVLFQQYSNHIEADLLEQEQAGFEPNAAWCQLPALPLSHSTSSRPKYYACNFSLYPG